MSQPLYAPEGSHSRPFQEVDVTNLNVQNILDRPDTIDMLSWGLAFKWNAFTQEQVATSLQLAEPIFHKDESSGMEYREFKAIPRVSQWRLNLVAMSQKYNLYFYASRTEIHVTRVRDTRQNIPAKPDAIIRYPLSAHGYLAPESIDLAQPHSANHILIGDLGESEILLIACDDGDVVAYYVDQIWRRLKPPKAVPDECVYIMKIPTFFHENVGISAWGLAIHKKSRMFAVSSNFGEVTLFVPATNKLAYNHDSEWSETRDWQILDDLDDRIAALLRKINFKLILRPEVEDVNIPSIAFGSYSNGEVQSIVATNVNGRLFVIRFGSAFRNTVCYGTEIPTAFKDSMGWGVLVLPQSAFMHVPSIYAALGTKDVDHLLAAERHEVRDASRRHIAHGFIPREIHEQPSNLPPPPIGDIDVTSESESEDSKLPYELYTTSSHMNYPQYVTDSAQLRALRRLELDRFCNKYRDDPNVEDFVDSIQHTQSRRTPLLETISMFLQAYPTPFLDDLTCSTFTEMGNCLREMEIELKVDESYPPREDDLWMLDGATILHTTQHDVELIPSTFDATPRTVCKSLNAQTVAGTRLAHIAGMDRLGMNAFIPELSLVVLGSQLGRVTLLTLTQLHDSHSRAGAAVTSMRVDHHLPFRSQENKDQRPHSPLLGIAVAPVQGYERQKGPMDHRLGMSRWRLFLHYYDHSILSYELSRDRDTDLLALA